MAVDGGRAFPRGEGEQEEIVEPYIRDLSLSMIWDDATISPRLALVMKPRADQSVRVSYNRAFRAPSAVNNNLDITLATPLPLGLFHSDHVITHQASLALLREALPLRWMCYEDTSYRCIPGLVQRRIARLSRGHRLSAPLINSKGLTSAKRQAVYCYASQLRGLSSAGRPGHLDALTAERYWPLGVEEETLL